MAKPRSPGLRPVTLAVALLLLFSTLAPCIEVAAQGNNTLGVTLPDVMHPLTADTEPGTSLPTSWYKTLLSDDPGYRTWHDFKNLGYFVDDQYFSFRVEHYAGAPLSGVHALGGFLFLDTDRNAVTGYPCHDVGADSVIEYRWNNINEGYAELYTWDAASGAFSHTKSLPVTGDAVRGTIVFQVDRMDLEYSLFFSAVVRSYAEDEYPLNLTGWQPLSEAVVTVDGSSADWLTSPAATRQRDYADPGWAGFKALYVSENSTCVNIRYDTWELPPQTLEAKTRTTTTLALSLTDGVTATPVDLVSVHNGASYARYGADQKTRAALGQVYETQIPLSDLQLDPSAGVKVDAQSLKILSFDEAPNTGHSSFALVDTLLLDAEAELYAKENALIKATVSTGQGPLLGATVTATIASLGVAVVRVQLVDDGTKGDAAAGDGVYSLLQKLPLKGRHMITVEASSGALTETRSVTLYTSNYGDAAAFVKASQNKDGGFGDRSPEEASQYYSAMAVLAPLDQGEVAKAVTWLTPESPPPSLRDLRYTLETLNTLGKLSSLNAATRSDTAARVAAMQAQDGGFGSLEETSHGVRILRILGSLSSINRKAAVGYLVSHQGTDGGFVDGSESSASASRTVVEALGDLEALDYVEAGYFENWAKSLLNRDGGFGATPGAPSSLASTRAVVEALRVFGKLAPYKDDVTRYVSELKNLDGGFSEASWTRSDFTSTVDAVSILNAYGELGTLNATSVKAVLRANLDSAVGAPRTPSTVTATKAAVEALQTAGTLSQANTTGVTSFVTGLYDPFTGAYWDSPREPGCVATQAAAVKSLNAIGSQPVRQAKRVAEYLVDSQRSGGGFSACPDPSGLVSIVDAYDALFALKTLSASSKVDSQGLVEWIVKRQTPEGGFADVGCGATCLSTYMAVSVLNEYSATRRIDLNAAASFLAERQQADGGFGGVEESRAALMGLQILGQLSRVDSQAAHQYLNRLQRVDGGYAGSLDLTWGSLAPTRDAGAALRVFSSCLGVFKGRVTTPQGEALTGVTVAVLDTAGCVVSSVLSGREGFFSLSLAEGPYTYAVIKRDTVPQFGSVYVPQGGSEEYRLTLDSTGPYDTQTAALLKPEVVETSVETVLSVTVTPNNSEAVVKGGVAVYEGSDLYCLISLKDNAAKGAVTKTLKIRKGVGEWSFKAVYLGDSSGSPSSSGVVKLKVTKPNTVTAITQDKTTIKLGETVKLTASSVAGKAGAVSGVISFEYSPNGVLWVMITSAPLTTSGGKSEVTCIWTPAAKGKLLIRARLTATEYEASESKQLTVTVS